MTITAKFSTVCPSCGCRIEAGEKVEWSKGQKARHVQCAAAGGKTVQSGSKSRNWDPNAFNGYGRARGGYRKACRTGGNCSSFGSGRSCGGHDCDGF